MKLLILDNYDSFTYNLVQIVREAGVDFEVHRNDRITVEESAKFDRILLSPGPGIPEEAGILKPLIAALAPTHPMLGICLGHQAIAEVFGGKLHNMETVLHGVASQVESESTDPLFAAVPERFQAGHYHSWVVKPEGFPETLRITARDSEGRIMGLRHQKLPVFGLQFHPESVLTPHGSTIIQNFLQLTEKKQP